jgi:branched-subunit amino acid transport protein AzlD
MSYKGVNAFGILLPISVLVLLVSTEVDSYSLVIQGIGWSLLLANLFVFLHYAGVCKDEDITKVDKEKQYSCCRRS